MESTQLTFLQKYRYHLIGGGLVLATGVGLIVWQVRKKRKQKANTWASSSPTTQAPSTPSRPSFCQSTDYPLRFGNCHPDVKILQTALKALGADLGTFGPNRDGIDGKFGTVTQQVVKSRFGKTSVSREEMERIKAGLNKWRGR